MARRRVSIGGWTAIAKTSAALDTVANATSHLADNNVFTEAMNRLPSGALVRAYANGQEAQTLLAVVPSTGKLPRQRMSVWVAAALTSTSDGLKLEAFARAGS